MFLGSKVNCRKFSDSGFVISINNEEIKMVNKIKYLGVVLDAVLSFSSYVHYMCKKIGKKVVFLCRIS